jgi:hypothetical protein
MTFVQDLEAKFSHLKDVAEDDLHHLVLKLEAVFNRVHLAVVSDGLKQAVSNDIHAALEHVAVVADSVRAKADLAVETVDEADSALDAVVAKSAPKTATKASAK